MSATKNTVIFVLVVTMESILFYMTIVASTAISVTAMEKYFAAATYGKQQRQTTLFDENTDMAIRYLRRYGYLRENTQTIAASKDYIDSEKINGDSVRQALTLFQEFYRIPGKGLLNNITIEQMKRPRCGLPDISHDTIKKQKPIWPTRHLTWNFHLATETILKTTKAAFDTWSANTSLIFERSTMNPNILLSFREGNHVFVQKNGAKCDSTLDGPGGVLAHAFYPTGSMTHIGEVHIDKTENWHIKISNNPPDTNSLLYILIHEIGHVLGMDHSERADSVMFPSAPENVTLPITLNLEDTFTIQRMYGMKKSTDFHVNDHDYESNTDHSIDGKDYEDDDDDDDDDDDGGDYEEQTP